MRCSDLHSTCSKWLLSTLLFLPGTLLTQEYDFSVVNSNWLSSNRTTALQDDCILEKSHSGKPHRRFRGPRGPRGHKGNKGATGLQGASGLGATGPQGPTGAPGANAPIPVPGTLFFTYTTRQDPSPTASGRWQLFIIAPDDTITAGPIVNIQDPGTTIVVPVGPPTLLGRYSTTIYNIDLNNLSMNNVFNDLVVTNSVDSTKMHQFEFDTSGVTDSPGSAVQDSFQVLPAIPPFP